MVVNARQSPQSLQATAQYRQTQPNRPRMQSEQAPNQERVTIQNRRNARTERTSPQQAAQPQGAESMARRRAVAAYENANRALQQPAAPEKQNERTLNALRA